MARVIVSRRAEEDLALIWEYTLEKWSINQAVKYLKLLNGHFVGLLLHPKSGKSIHHLREGYYQITAESHLVFYKITKGNIYIMRVLHKKTSYIVKLRIK